MGGCHPEEKSFLVVGEEGWCLKVGSVGLGEPGAEVQRPSPSPASAGEWACCPGSTGPGSGGRCLRDKEQRISKSACPCLYRST